MNFDPASPNPVERLLAAFPRAAPVPGFQGAWRVGIQRDQLTLSAPKFPWSDGAKFIGENKLCSVAKEVFGEGGDVIELLKEVERIWTERAKSKRIRRHLRGPARAASVEVLTQLDSLGWDRVAQSNEDFSEVSLKIRTDDDGEGPTVGLRLSAGFPEDPPEVIHCDLPAVAASAVHPAKGRTLQDLVEQYEDLASLWSPALMQLQALDEYAWVIDPEKPSRWKDLFRRIVVVPGVTLLLELSSPDEGCAVSPSMRFFGPDHSAAPLRQKMRDYSDEDRWDPDWGLVRNLKSALELELPTPEAGDCEDFGVECCVCYATRLGHALPEKSCNNWSCGKKFHVECLFEYLQSNVENRKSMNVIYGTCPYCESAISCEQPD